MLVIPAIDLIGGRCVRLYQGSFDQATEYSEDPVEVARRWQNAGAEWVHIVDLDGAREGAPKQLDVLPQIRQATSLRIEFGGGLRTLEAVEQAAAAADRIVLGTAAVRNPDLVKQALARFGGAVAVGIDARSGLVATDGWQSGTTRPAKDLAEEMQDLGVKTIIFTDIETDGTLRGPNFKVLQEMRTLRDIQLIASGGIASLAHIRQLARFGMDGCILGKALYEGAIDLTRALHEVEDSDERYEW